MTMQLISRPARILFTALLLAGFALCAPAVAQRAVAVDRVVAVVNDEVITAVELDMAVQRVAGQLRRQGIELPPRAVLDEQVLERMILERAQVQLARENGIRVDEATMGRAIERIRDNAGLTEEGLRAALEADGITWEKFRESLRNEILVSRLREAEVERQITVTEAEIDNFIANNPDTLSGREVLVSHILIRVPEDVTEQQFERLMERARTVKSRHAAGEEFAQLAAEFSDAPDATDGGVIGWRSPDGLPRLFADAITGLQPGEVSEIMRSAAGLHLVKLARTRSAGVEEPDQVEQTRARHILVRTTEVLSDEEVENRLLTLRERIEFGESFEDLAKVHSDDLSAARGGDLGWVFRGDTVPEFERAMDALEPGEVSMPVKSPFGWHLIQVVERRMQDVTDERIRGMVRNSLRERKSDESYDSWLRELRDSTYVEIRLDRD